MLGDGDIRDITGGRAVDVNSTDIPTGTSARQILAEGGTADAALARNHFVPKPDHHNSQLQTGQNWSVVDFRERLRLSAILPAVSRAAGGIAVYFECD